MNKIYTPILIIASCFIQAQQGYAAGPHNAAGQRPQAGSKHRITTALMRVLHSPELWKQNIKELSLFADNITRYTVQSLLHELQPADAQKMLPLIDAIAQYLQDYFKLMPTFMKAPMTQQDMEKIYRARLYLEEQIDFIISEAMNCIDLEAASTIYDELTDMHLQIEAFTAAQGILVPLLKDLRSAFAQKALAAK